MGSGTPPPKNHKKIGFLSNTGPALLKNKPAFNVGPFKKVPVFIKLSTCGEAKLIIDYTQ